jgi:hypothetical protein
MAEPPLSARIAEALAAGRGESAGGVAFLPLIELDAGARLGVDADARWLVAPAGGGAPARFGPGAEHVLLEAIERKRSAFEDELARAARAAGLDEGAVLDAFPFVPVARFVLGARSPYLLRLTLEWLRPTELRDLRDAIAGVVDQADLPVPVRDLARRLLVPA